MISIEEVQKRIGVRFKNTDLLNEALTHRSYINENPEWKQRNNERLEFLGDAVLELIITDELFRRFPEKEEGELTIYRAADRKSTRLNSSHIPLSRMPSSA